MPLSLGYTLRREEAIATVLSLLGSKDIVVSTTGMISREVYENRSSHEKDFLTVGSMGHASSIALGIALAKPQRRVFCFDGDGAMLMHLGAAPIIASCSCPNLKHILFNNNAHDSVGGQPTAMSNINVDLAFRGLGYSTVIHCTSADDIRTRWKAFVECNAPALMEICVAPGARPDLGRPTENPIDNKLAFMDFIHD